MRGIAHRALSHSKAPWELPDGLGACLGKGSANSTGVKAPCGRTNMRVLRNHMLPSVSSLYRSICLPARQMLDMAAVLD